MSISVYYNEFDPKAAAWLRQLIKNGNITPGEVDERSITEIGPDDLIGFDRVHFFAGIGTWDYCLNQAGWGNKPVWTASLPCQPFSAAGKGLGKSDERHLLPHFLELVRQCKPDAIFGEQVERAIAFGWLDDLQANMEAENYAVGHVVLGAHSIGAAHIRQRLYWVANSISNGNQRAFGRINGETNRGEISDRSNVTQSGESSGTGSNVCGMVYSDESRSQQGIEAAETARHGDTVISAGGVNRMADSEIVIGQYQAELEWRSDIERCSATNRMGNTEHEQYERRVSGYREESSKNGKWPASEFTGLGEVDWIYCRDNKYRAVKPGIKPLVDGIARGVVRSGDPGEPINANETQEARVMRLKGYGNAIQAQTAMAFISAYMSILNG